MMRGSSFILRDYSIKAFEPVIVLIATYDKNIWKIDVDKYTDANIEVLLDFKAKLKEVFGNENKATDTLVTKIMLGVFGNIPAYDRFFRDGLGVNNTTKLSLIKIKEFYETNKLVIDKAVKESFVYDFYGKPLKNLKYSKAKIIDMIFFVEGGGFNQ